MAHVPDFDDDFINSTDVIAHVAMLATELAALPEDATDDEREEITEEAAAWERLREAFGDDQRWAEGVTFIQDLSKFMDECVEDQFGSASRLDWPFTCVDWDRALEEFEQHYTDITITDDWGAEHCYRVR